MLKDIPQDVLDEMLRQANLSCGADRQLTMPQFMEFRLDEKPYHKGYVEGRETGVALFEVPKSFTAKGDSITFCTGCDEQDGWFVNETVWDVTPSSHAVYMQSTESGRAVRAIMHDGIFQDLLRNDKIHSGEFAAHVNARPANVESGLYGEIVIVINSSRPMTVRTEINMEAHSDGTLEVGLTLGSTYDDTEPYSVNVDASSRIHKESARLYEAVFPGVLREQKIDRKKEGKRGKATARTNGASPNL